MASYSKKKVKGGFVWEVWFRVSENGKVKTKHLSGFKTKKDAEAAAEEYEPEREPPKGKGDSNFETALREYMKGRSGDMALSTHYDAGRIFSRHILPTFRSRDVTRIERADIIRWQTDMWSKTNPRTGRVYSQKTCVNVRSMFKTFMGWASDVYGFSDPFVGVKIPKRREMRREMNVWTEEQFEAFCEECPEGLVLFYKFLFYTGARVGEINALDREDIELCGDRYVIDIHKSVTRNTGGLGFVVSAPKTASGNRKVTLPRALTEETGRFLEGKDKFVFGGGKPIDDHRYLRCFAATAKKAGLPHIRIHDLRHSHATMLINSGVPITTVSKRLGHSTVKMTLDVYSHCYKEKEDEAVDFLDGVIKNTPKSE